MKAKILITLCAVIGCFSCAPVLTGPLRKSESITISPYFADSGAGALTQDGRRLLTLTRYFEARDTYLHAAQLSDAANDLRSSAMNRNNAGAMELLTLQYGDALRHFAEARRDAAVSGHNIVLASSMNNLASLYIQTGQPENALKVAREGLNGPARKVGGDFEARLLCQESTALSELHRFAEAAPVHREAIKRLTALNQLDDVVRLIATWSDDNIREGHLEEAADALSEGLKLVRANKVKAASGIMLGLANLASRRHQQAEAAKYFQAALDTKGDGVSRWRIFADRGRFRLEINQNEGALEDFREAGRLASQVRADMVPADQDRVAFETGIGKYLRGVVEAGNRVALQTRNAAILAETFDAAEQNRLWSLRSLVPGTSDWRSRLPSTYWEKLSLYQARQRRALATSQTAPDPRVASLQLELQEMEAAAGGHKGAERQVAGAAPLRYAQSLLDRNTVLFSFHVAPESSWVWAVSHDEAQVFRLPPETELKTLTSEFVGKGMATEPGRKLYFALFGAIPGKFARKSRWLLEPDGPLHDVPFSALVADEKAGSPIYLVERASLQIIPGALLLAKRPFRADGTFLGIGDPVYNAADARFQGEKRQPEFSLPRLPKTARELDAAAKAWGSGALLLTGMSASAEHLWQNSGNKTAVLHFATHVVAGTGEHRSGLIALRLNPRGAMDLLGPTEILARTVSADLVVMNGCHSAQGEAVPSSGRMGLTRAWIGAGATGVLATQWDIADDDAESIMSDFYRNLRRTPEQGVAEALRQAQLAVRHSSRGELNRWAGYYLLSRAL